VRPGFAILIGQGPWRLAIADEDQIEVCDLPAEGESLDGKAAARIASRMKTRNYDGGPVVLAIPSTWALAASVSTENLPRRNRYHALLYRLEEQLPLPAEELVADFVEHGSRALGVAVEIRRLRGILYELEAAGIVVQTILPAALLAMQGFVPALGADGPALAAVALNGQVELAEFDAGRICTWETVEQSESALNRAIRAKLLTRSFNGPFRLVVQGLDENLQNQLAEVVDLDVLKSQGDSVLAACGRTAAEVLTGRTRAWFDLRRDQLAPGDRLRPIRRAMNVCVSLIVALLAGLAGALLWRTAKYENLTRDMQTQQARTYQALYPGQPVPPSVRLRLESEVRRVSGLRGVSAQAPRRHLALDTLRRIVTRLPSRVRLRILDLRVEPAGFVVEGQSRQHGDAEMVAAELGKDLRLAVEPPRTERSVQQGVAFTLSGRLLGPEGGTGPP